VPELPEAETVRRQLEQQLVGRKIIQSWARLPRITFPNIETFARETQNQTIIAAKRRGKQIYFPLSNGQNLLIHLGMTGQVRVIPGEAVLLPDSFHKHIHAALALDNSTQLIFTDPRTFGKIGVSVELPFLQTMGPEPLDEDFDAHALAQKLAGRATKIKNALLDQKLVAGLGNIYADEVLWLARVHPETHANNISTRKMREIVGHMKPVLERAIAARGATLQDGGYQDVFGQYGEYHPHAYGNTGKPCERCGAPIQRGVLGAGKSGRSFHFCPKCQKRKEAK